MSKRNDLRNFINESVSLEELLRREQDLIGGRKLSKQNIKSLSSKVGGVLGVFFLGSLISPPVAAALGGSLAFLHIINAAMSKDAVLRKAFKKYSNAVLKGSGVSEAEDKLTKAIGNADPKVQKELKAIMVKVKKNPKTLKEYE